MANERRPQSRQVTPKQMAEFQEMDRQWRLEFMPPQLDINGVERLCVHCHSPLHPWHSQNYDGSVGGFCNKLCMKNYERKLISDGSIGASDAEMEIEKYEDWKPKKHSPVA